MSQGVLRDRNQPCTERSVGAQPERVIVENLTHRRGKANGKKMSRVVSMWMRSILNERANFKTEARGSCLEAVASAYTSQECSYCGYTTEKNRDQDHFRCLNCGTVDTADGNAAKVMANVSMILTLNAG